MMDEYRKGWALRYLREAKAELEAAKKIPYMAPSLVLEAIRKARNRCITKRDVKTISNTLG